MALFNPNNLFSFFKRKKGAKAEMSFWEHIEDLRGHIFRSVVAIFAAGVVFFANKKFLFDNIIFAPKKARVHNVQGSVLVRQPHSCL